MRILDIVFDSKDTENSDSKLSCIRVDFLYLAGATVFKTCKLDMGKSSGKIIDLDILFLCREHLNRTLLKD